MAEKEAVKNMSIIYAHVLNYIILNLDINCTLNQRDKSMKKLTFLCLAILLCNTIFSQTGERREKLTIDGNIVTALITENNDTILIADLEDISVSSLRSFDDPKEYRRYLKYRRYAGVVYPYAVEAIRIFRETEYVTNNMNNRKRKRHIKRLQKELKKEFKAPLKNLTRTQGKILVKMIERELNTPFYTLVKSLRGGVTATYWSSLGKLYGYKFKEGYTEGEDPIMDAVLHDFNVSYEMDLEELEAKDN